jgi:hypothetical protein
MKLLSGSYIYEDDFSRDRVVLNEALAWALFGATDVAGMSVTIGDVPYFIAGVVQSEDDPASVKAGADEPCIFVHIEEFHDYGDSVISSYELVMPNPIKNYARNFAMDKLQGDGVVVENSGRYSLSNIFEIIMNFGDRSMGESGILFPYWENAARYTEDMAALRVVLAAVAALVPLGFAVLLAVATYKALKAEGKRVAKRFTQ